MTLRHFPFALLLLAGLVQPAAASGLRLLTHPLPPFTTGSETEPSGLAVDMVRAIMKHTGEDIPITTEPFARLLPEVQAGPSTVGFIIARRPVRETTMQWVGPLVTSASYLYMKAGSAVTVATLDDARKLGHIGVQRGNGDDEFLTAQGFTNLERSSNQALDIKRLARGWLDAMPCSELVFTYAVRNAGLKLSDFERTKVRFVDVPVYIGVSPDVPKTIVTAWQAALDGMKASGEYAAILARYRGE